MQKKIFVKLCLAVGMFGLASCSNSSSWWNSGEYEYAPEVNDSVFDEQYMPMAEAQMYADNPSEAAKVYNKRIPPLNSLVVCRAKQCAPAELSMSREYIFNSLAHLIDNNLDATALLCEANPQAHVCTNPYLTVPAKIGVTPAYVFFDGVKIVDASAVKGKTALNLALGYNLSYNGQTPTVCKPDMAMMYVKSNNGIVLNGNGFKCNMTSVGTTTIRVMFDIDYIDLDYGYIGGYYSIGLSGPANGGGSGYGLIRLVKDAHPLNPELMAPAEKDNTMAVKPTVKLEVKDGALKPVVEIDEEPRKTTLGQGEQQPREKLSLPEDMTSSVAGKNNIDFEHSDENLYVNPAQPVKTTPEAIVRGDKIILNDKPQELRPIDVSGRAEEPAFEEIEVEDLDEYIK